MLTNQMSVSSFSLTCFSSCCHHTAGGAAAGGRAAGGTAEVTTCIIKMLHCAIRVFLIFMLLKNNICRHMSSCCFSHSICVVDYLQGVFGVAV